MTERNPKTFDYYNKMRREQKRQYQSTTVQRQMVEDRKKLGEKAFYSKADPDVQRREEILAAVEQMLLKDRGLVDLVGRDNVCVWTSKHDLNSKDETYSQKFAKSEVKDYGIAVICHKAVSENGKALFLGDRDLWVWDEEPENSRFSSVSLADFAHAHEWANSVGDKAMIATTREALDWATVTYDNIKANFEPVECLPWVLEISSWDMLALRKADPAVTLEVNELNQFCKAVVIGMGFVNSRSYGDVKVISFNGISSELAYPEKTVILSATAWVSGYKLAPDKYTAHFDGYLPEPDYRNLSLVHLDKPAGLPIYYKTFSGSRSAKAKMTNYLETLVADIPERKVFITCPKAILPLVQDCDFVEGKEVFTSHHGIGTGSNDWQDCDAVIYFLDDHKPGAAHVAKRHAIVGDEITKETLDDAQNYLRGSYQDVKRGSYLSNMIQLLGRGRVRQRYDDGSSHKMTAYMVVDKRYFDMLSAQFPKCQVEYRSKPSTKGAVLSKYADFLREQVVEAPLSVKYVSEQLGIKNYRKYTSDLKADKDGILKGSGYQFQKGESGRYGTGHLFVPI
ncbi:hypothetical protein C1J05_04090 [Sulfitobacter sp. JL08]|uniref:hypothetical protein n=1 Tax=Sulfitobacter sp. JL08 TaxID=2070369 RepID=UPI000E09F123|nr:hypothetical protein [Sulfitobacter sp. JL08]AXI53789.1 hypothetical protein C1J05_04090 [Sulfitobacter sp. JL08]